VSIVLVVVIVFNAITVVAATLSTDDIAVTPTEYSAPLTASTFDLTASLTASTDACSKLAFARPAALVGTVMVYLMVKAPEANNRPFGSAADMATTNVIAVGATIAIWAMPSFTASLAISSNLKVAGSGTSMLMVPLTCDCAGGDCMAAAIDVGACVLGASVFGATVLGASVVSASVVGTRIFGASVVGVAVLLVVTVVLVPLVVVVVVWFVVVVGILISVGLVMVVVACVVMVALVVVWWCSRL